MKNSIALIALITLFFSHAVTAQDTVYVKGNHLICGSILEMDSEKLKIKWSRSGEDMTRTFQLSELEKAVLRDGETVVFNQTAQKTPKKRVTEVLDSEDRAYLEAESGFLLKNKVIPANYQYDNPNLNALLFDIVNDKKASQRHELSGDVVMILGGILTLTGVLLYADTDKKSNGTFVGDVSDGVGRFFGGTMILGGVITMGTSAIPFSKAKARKREMNEGIAAAKQFAYEK